MFLVSLLKLNLQFHLVNCFTIEQLDLQVIFHLILIYIFSFLLLNCDFFLSLLFIILPPVFLILPVINLFIKIKFSLILWKTRGQIEQFEPHAIRFVFYYVKHLSWSTLFSFNLIHIDPITGWPYSKYSIWLLAELMYSDLNVALSTCTNDFKFLAYLFALLANIWQ